MEKNKETDSEGQSFTLPELKIIEGIESLCDQAYECVARASPTSFDPTTLSQPAKNKIVFNLTNTLCAISDAISMNVDCTLESR